MSSIRMGHYVLQRLLPLISRKQVSSITQTCCRCASTEMKESTVKPEETLTDLTLTDSCVAHLKKFATSGEFLRISVEGGGCSGFSYKFDLETDKEEDDLTFTKDGVEVVTDVDSFELIKGSKIDYESELIKSSFKVVDNPQSSTNCSCGVSFSIDL